MFIVNLTFSDNKSHAAEYMAGHNEWIKQGFEDGVFLMVGSIEPGRGGVVLAHNATLEALEARVQQDPFVVENVVSAEVLHISPKKADERLNFLMPHSS